jgi:hypothetical protein
MVLHGAQFRRSGPAVCALLPKQAPSSDITALTPWRAGPCLISRSQMNPDTGYRGQRKSVLAIKDSRTMVRERVMYGIGILGNRDWSLGLGGHALGVHGRPRIEEPQESSNVNTG